MKRTPLAVFVSPLLLLLIVTLAGSASYPVPTAGTSSPAQAERVFFGNLRSHTSFSDGSGIPEEA